MDTCPAPMVAADRAADELQPAAWFAYPSQDDGQTRMTTDRELVEKTLAGHPGAFERVVRAHQALCWHIVLKLVRDPEDTRDLCQDIFLRVHRSLDQYRFDSSLATWIGRIAYHRALRYLESRRIPLDREFGGEEGEAALERIEGGDDPGAGAEARQIDALVQAQMRRLPPIQSLLLTLYHLDELTIPEISTMTGLPPGTIKSYLARGRARLRDALATTIGERP
jgi:RNA polymerase sigma factor (sigma-70 family)